MKSSAIRDHLGSVSLVTDYNINPANVKVVSEVYYKPYGDKVLTASSGPDMFRHKYTGQEDDPETSLMYYGARYYDPGIGRFITADNIVPGSDSLFNKNTGKSLYEQLSYHSNSNRPTFNRYMYVNGNPIQYRDPSGHSPDWLGFFGGLALIAVAAAVIIFAAPIAAAIGLTAALGASLGAGIVTGVGIGVGTLGMSIAEAGYNDCNNTCNIGFSTEVTAQTDFNGNMGGGSSSEPGGSRDSMLYGSFPLFNTDPYTPIGCPLLSGCEDFNSSYGIRTLNGITKFHYGLDYGWGSGETPYIVATMEGYIKRYDSEQTGLEVRITNDYFMTRDIHMSEVFVQNNQYVFRGQIIGIAGNTGSLSQGPHLHHEVYNSNGIINPINYIFSVGRNWWW